MFISYKTLGIFQIFRQMREQFSVINLGWIRIRNWGSDTGFFLGRIRFGFWSTLVNPDPVKFGPDPKL